MQVRIHTALDVTTFKRKHLHPDECNLQETSDTEAPIASPLYTSSIASDVSVVKQNEFMTQTLDGCSGVKHGIRLCKVWLRQRCLDSVTRHEILQPQTRMNLVETCCLIPVFLDCRDMEVLMLTLWQVIAVFW